MKIIIVSNVYPYPERGYFPGIERVVANHARMLSQRGHQVVILTTFRNGDKKCTTEGEIDIYRLPDLRSDIGQLGSLLSIDRVYFSLRAKQLINNLAEIDVIHTHTPLLFSPRDLPLVSHHHHWKSYDEWKDYLWLPMIKWQWLKTYRKSTKVISVSKYSMEQLSFRGIPQEIISTVYHGVDLTHFSPEGENIKRYSHCNDVILYVGPLIERKGIDVLLRAFNQVRSEIANPQLVLVGDGNIDYYRRLSEELGIKAATHFEGFVDDEQLPKYYRTADLFVLPSRLEGFGQVLLEAMASGTPVVGTNTSAIPEVIGDAGCLVPPDEESLLAAEMCELLENKEKRDTLRSRGLKRARETFSWDNQVSVLEDVYKDAVSSSNQ